MSRRETLAEDEILWAHRRWCEGYPQNELAKALFVAPSSLNKMFSRRGLKRQRMKLEYSPRSRSARFRELSDYALAQEIVKICPSVAFWLENSERNGKPRTDYAIERVMEYLAQTEVDGNGK